MFSAVSDGDHCGTALQVVNHRSVPGLQALALASAGTLSTERDYFFRSRTSLWHCTQLMVNWL